MRKPRTPDRTLAAFPQYAAEMARLRKVRKVLKLLVDFPPEEIEKIIELTQQKNVNL